MNKDNYSIEWFNKAKTDLATAQFLLDMKPIPIDVICYHCEQTIEKALKGLLVKNNIDPPKTHDLVELCKSCCEFNDGLESFMNAFIELTPYAVNVRYPSEEELDVQDMNFALEEATKIIDYVTPLFDLEEDESQEWDLSL